MLVGGGGDIVVEVVCVCARAQGKMVLVMFQSGPGSKESGLKCPKWSWLSYVA